jgi:hypothetical protein
MNSKILINNLKDTDNSNTFDCNKIAAEYIYQRGKCLEIKDKHKRFICNYKINDYFDKFIKICLEQKKYDLK